MSEEKPLTTEQLFFKNNPKLDPALTTAGKVTAVEQAFIQGDLGAGRDVQKSWVWDDSDGQAGAAMGPQLDSVNPLGIDNFVEHIKSMEKAFANMGKSFVDKMGEGIDPEIKFDPFTEVLLAVQVYAETAPSNHASLIGVSGQVAVLFIELAELKALIMHPEDIDLVELDNIRAKLLSILYQTAITVIELDNENMHGAG